MIAEMLQTDSTRWVEVLKRVGHDIYHLPQYAALAAQLDGGQPVAFLAEEEESVLLLPLLLRKIPSGYGRGVPVLLDATSPYGYPGPVVSATADRTATFVARAVDRLASLLGEMGVVSLFVRLHPLLPLPLEPFVARGIVVHHGETVAIDLQSTSSELRSQMKKKHRRFLTKMERMDHEVSITDSRDNLADFLDLYRDTMDRVGASRYYYFSEDYLEAMFSLLPGKVHLAFLSLGGQKATVDLLLETGGFIQTHLGATRRDFLRVSPSIPLTYYECLWAQERGNRYLHLGGGVGGEEDSLFAFKAGFSTLRFPFRTWRMVTDPAAYGRLVAAWEGEAGRAADPADGFFPAYRKPLLDT